MKKEQAREYYGQLKKLDKAKHMGLAEVINIITGGTIPLQKARNFIEQHSNNEFGDYSDIYEYLQLSDWKDLEFEQIHIIIKCIKNYLKKGRTLTELNDNSQLDPKETLAFNSNLQTSGLESIASQLHNSMHNSKAEMSEQASYQQRWKQGKFKVVKKLLIVFDFIRKWMRIQGESFEVNQKICEKIDINIFMKYAKMFELGSHYKPEKLIKSFKDNAVNQLWMDFDRFVNANLQIIGFEQTMECKQKYAKLRGLADLLSSEKIKKMLNIRNRSAIATIVEGHTGTYKQDILDYLKQKYEERKMKLDKKWHLQKVDQVANHKLITEGDHSRITDKNRLSQVKSANSLPKRAKTLEARSIYDELKLPKLRLKESRQQSIYQSLKLLDLRKEEPRVRELVNAEQDEEYLREYLRKQQLIKKKVGNVSKKGMELPRMKFT